MHPTRVLIMMVLSTSLCACSTGNQYSISTAAPDVSGVFDEEVFSEEVVLAEDGSGSTFESAAFFDERPIFISQQTVTLGSQQFIYGGVGPLQVRNGLVDAVLSAPNGVRLGSVLNALTPINRATISLGVGAYSVAVGVQPGNSAGLGSALTTSFTTPATPVASTVGTLGNAGSATVSGVVSTVSNVASVPSVTNGTVLGTASSVNVSPIVQSTVAPLTAATNSILSGNLAGGINTATAAGPVAIRLPLATP